MINNKFNYNTLEELKNHIKELGLNIPLSTDTSILAKPITIGDKIIPNPMAIHPMEGCDGTTEGEPDFFTIRRYDRFSRGGAGLLWVEATAVVEEGRANPRQLCINNATKKSFQQLNINMLKASQEEFGEAFRPYTVLQLTHSGRYSKPVDIPEPIIATNNPYLDKFLAKDYKIITDEELEKLEDAYIEAAILAKECGFDAVDLKSCHRYLNSELLSAFTREGKYGGSFENRTRFLLNIIDKIKNSLGEGIDITLRMNAYDAIPYPYGFGVDKNDHHKPDLEEPIKLLKLLSARGIKLINISCGNPYYNPHVGRPYDMGAYVANEHPLESLAKMLNIIKELQQSVPEMVVLATGFTWFREFAANVMAGGIKEGWFKMAGFGRQAFAYPDFGKDIMKSGKLQREKCCITCSKCTEIMRDGGKTGCVIKDSEVYAPLYKAGREGKPSLVGRTIGEHI
jgi:2,4-dienoyl-CoA reductase-like NADH-dependent reductase (Old Yellow Enzyme family)